MGFVAFQKNRSMSTSNSCRKTLCRLALLAAALLIPTGARAGQDPADLRTTTFFTPPQTFGVAADGVILPGDPLIGLEIVEV